VQEIGAWLLAGLRSLTLRRLSGFMLGTQDERSSTRVAREAVLDTARWIRPRASVEDADFLAKTLAEHLQPASAIERAQLAGTSVLDNVESLFTSQLRGLYEPMPSGTSAAAELGIGVGPAEVAHHLVESIAQRVAFVPRDAQGLWAIREEWLHRRSAMEPALPRVVCRYLLCTSFELLGEIAHDGLANLPVDNPRLVHNNVSELWALLAREQGSTDRSDELLGGGWRSLHAYLERHPDARPCGDSFPDCETLRECTSDDVEAVAQDPVSRMLLNVGVPVNDLAVAVGRGGGCGDRIDGLEFSEWYVVRPVWGLMLELRVESTRSVTFQSLHGLTGGDGLTPLSDVTDAKSTELPMPPIPVSPGESVVVPIATLLPRVPVQADPSHELDTTEVRFVADHPHAKRKAQDLVHDQYQRLTEQSLPRAIDMWGRHLIPMAVTLEGDGVNHTQELREFDPQRVYTVDRHWMIGSCPHAFLHYTDSTIEYAGALFVRGPGRLQRVSLRTPPGVCELEIAELEPEVSVLVRLQIGGKTRERWRLLRRGGSIRVAVDYNGADIEIVGLYLAMLGVRRDRLVERSATVARRLAAHN
jgi:hypothetical protein